MYSAVDATPPVTVRSLRAQKQRGEKIVALTAYDASFARVLDEQGVDMVLVGDSLGNVIQGRGTTLPVRVEDMIYHGAAVARGLRRALLVIDMPFASYPEPRVAFAQAARVMAETGAAMVKLEGAGHVLESIAYLSARDIPVCAHLGLTPQSVHKLGGYRVQGREPDAAQRLLADARAVVEAGADLLVLELVPAALAAAVARAVEIPVIGIGAGAQCDGQILVCYDMLGVTPGKRPKFSRDFLAGRGSVAEAVRAYVDAVRAGTFPGADEVLA
jgi:3-methyl-2-oxobutanoate hydroxymethyltransferase